MDSLLVIAVYFLCWAGGLIVALEIFAWALRIMAQMKRSIRIALSLIAYCAVAGVFFLPLAGMQLLHTSGVPSDEATRTVAISLYLLCLLVAVLTFKRRHARDLKALGYFGR